MGFKLMGGKREGEREVADGVDYEGEVVMLMVEMTVGVVVHVKVCVVTDNGREGCGDGVGVVKMKKVRRNERQRNRRC